MGDIGCACECDCGDYYCNVYNRTTPTARKDHRCCECGETIKPGETYEHVRSLYDGGWSTHKTCMLCCRIRADLVRDSCCHGGLREVIYDCFGFNYVTGSIAEWAEDNNV